MVRFDRRPFVPVALLCAVATFAGAEDVGDRGYLVRVSAGERTTDTGLEDKTKPETIDEPALGGKAMKVAFAAGDSIGANAKIKDWTGFARFQVETVNPGAEVALELNIAHAQSKNYETRVVVPLTVKAGKSEIVVPLGALKNVDGSAPDLKNVVRWFLADAGEKSPTLLFGDIALVKEGAAPISKPAAAAPSAVLPLLPSGAAPTGYRITGMFGNQQVDLTVTPLGAAHAVAAPPVGAVKGDPARLARLRQTKMPAVTRPIMFNTPEADAVCAALEVYPEDHPFNLLVDQWPVHPDSAAIIGAIGAEKPLRYNPDMGFVLVPPNHPRSAVKTAEPGESDPGPFPLVDDLPIEGWPAAFERGDAGKPTLDDVQRDKQNQGGDRHAIVVDPTNRILYEFYQMKKVGGGWEANHSSIFDLKSHKLRPDSWTSADAAGLPMFPAVVRHDELARGMIEHALRVTVARSRKAYVHPATHQAGHGDDPSLPRMGERLRLKSAVAIGRFSPPVRTILQALKTYGMFVADNGLDWCISVTPDARIPVLHEELRKLKGSDFEVVTPQPGYQPRTSD